MIEKSKEFPTEGEEEKARGFPLTVLLNQQGLELILYCNIVYYP
jgi:hypothetical protein